MEGIHLGPGPVKCGLYKQVVFIQVVFRADLTVRVS